MKQSCHIGRRESGTCRCGVERGGQAGKVSRLWRDAGKGLCARLAERGNTGYAGDVFGPTGSRLVTRLAERGNTGYAGGDPPDQKQTRTSCCAE
jgi:hypothetical protein